MDGIGGEVSHKIRSAIKAKLMELGAYADDELPDYIMVMVANKRSRQQMEEDLQLFLGENTVTFTAWLHTVLNKLQQVSIANLESKKAMDAERKKRPSTEEHKKEKKKKARKEKDKDKGKDEKSDERDERVKNRNEERKKWKVNEEKTESSEHKTHMKEHVQELKSSEPVVTVASSAVKQGEKKMTDDEDEDFLNLKADIEADLWGDGENEEMPQARTKFAKSSQLDPGKITVSSYADPSKLATLQAEVVESTKPPATLPNNSLPTAGNLEPIPFSGKALLEKVENSSPVKGSERPQPRIIKISETLRQEQETIHPSIKRAAEPQNEKGMKITHSPVRYKSQESEAKEDDAEIFGRHIAHELRQLTQRQRNLAKLKIQQVIYDCQDAASPDRQSKKRTQEHQQHYKQGNRLQERSRKQTNSPRNKNCNNRGIKRSDGNQPQNRTLSRPNERLGNRSTEKCYERITDRLGKCPVEKVDQSYSQSPKKKKKKRKSPLRLRPLRMDSPTLNKPKDKFRSPSRDSGTSQYRSALEEKQSSPTTPRTISSVVDTYVNNHSSSSVPRRKLDRSKFK